MGKVAHLVNGRLNVTSADWIQECTLNGELSHPRPFRGILLVQSGSESGGLGGLVTRINEAPTRSWLADVGIFLIGAVAMACYTASVATIH